MPLFARSLCILIFLFCVQAQAQTRLLPEILAQEHYDEQIFTQGLVLQQGKFFASSGLYGRSFIRRYDANTNQTEKELAIPGQWFAEGLTLLNQQLFVLTWKAGIALVLDPHSLNHEKSFQYEGEGWGLTHNQSELIMSDGSANLHFHDPATFKRLRTIQVHNRWRKFDKLNELEFAEGAIWANVWQSNTLLKIAPDSGEVLALVALDDIAKKHARIPGHTVLNGIAYDSEHKAFWVTGKLWPKRYLIRFSETPNAAEKAP